MGIDDLYGFECIPMNNQMDIDDFFEKMKKEGEKEGYTPIIIIDEKGGLLKENINIIKKEYGSLEKYEEYCLEKYKQIDVSEFFENRKNNISGLLEELNQSDDTFYDFKNFSSNRSIDIFEDKNRIYIAKIPTTKPYEVFAYIPIGGFNDCPSDEEHIAVAKHWFENYGVYPVAIGCDTVQYIAKNQIKTKLDTLCMELILYCEDIIIQGYETIRALKDILQRSTVWLFWWD